MGNQLDRSGKHNKGAASYAQSLTLDPASPKIGVLLRQAREAAGLTQAEVAERLGTKKSAISRMENHANDVRLSTLQNYAEAVGSSLTITLSRPSSGSEHATRT